MRLTQLKEGIMEEGKADTASLIQAYKTGKIRLKPGCDALQSLESELNGLLGKIRQRCGDAAMVELQRSNAPFTMAQCGSKGSPLNISQVMNYIYIGHKERQNKE
jgi:DNA-directed RNA polymerase III subunit RPC1